MGENKTLPDGYGVSRVGKANDLSPWRTWLSGVATSHDTEEDAEQSCRVHRDRVCAGEYERGIKKGKKTERDQWEARAMELATWSDCKPYPWAEGWHPRQVLRFLVADMIDRRENAEAALAEHDRELQVKTLDDAAAAWLGVPGNAAQQNPYEWLRERAKKVKSNGN